MSDAAYMRRALELARRGQRADLLREVEELVRGVTHGGHRDDHVVAGLLGLRDALGDALDALGVGEGRAAVLLDDDGGHRDSRDVVAGRRPL